MDRDVSKGMHWLGHPGSLRPVVDLGEESVTDDITVQTFEPLGGGRRVFVPRRRPLRSWQLSIPSAHADEVAHLRTLLAATMPPYVLVTSDAQVSNVLTPERSVMGGLLQGSVSLAGSWPIASESGGGWTTITGLNPAAAGGAGGLVRIGPASIPPLWTQRPVTISVLLATSRAAGCYASLEWLDAAGSQVGASVQGTTVTGMDALRRSSVTATPVWGAAAVRIRVLYAEVISQPQVTWTGAVIPEWTPGNGADRVVITSSSRSTSMAVPESRSLRRGDHSYTLVETL